MFEGRLTVENKDSALESLLCADGSWADIARGVGIGFLSEMGVRVEEQFRPQNKFSCKAPEDEKGTKLYVPTGNKSYRQKA
jgi:hypothetical protein